MNAGPFRNKLNIPHVFDNEIKSVIFRGEVIIVEGGKVVANHEGADMVNF